MEKLLTLLLFVLSLNLAAQQYNKMVVCREDNDICTSLDTMSKRKPMPMNVIGKFNHYYSADTSMINQVFEIKFDPYLLYVVWFVKIVDWDEEYHFWIYDSCTKTFSSYPYIINGQWMSHQEEGFDIKLLSYPLVYNDHGYLWVKERVHNGNSYNAVITHKLLCDKNLNLQLILCIEEVSLCYFPWMGPEEYTLFYRVTRGDDIVCIKKTSGECDTIGSYHLSKKGKISQVKVFDKLYSYFIVTSSGYKPKTFVKHYFKQHRRKDNKK